MKHFVPVVIDGIDNPYDAITGILIFNDVSLEEAKEALLNIEIEYHKNDYPSFEGVHLRELRRH